jgi:hypothetical protein
MSLFKVKQRSFGLTEGTIILRPNSEVLVLRESDEKEGKRESIRNSFKK